MTEKLSVLVNSCDKYDDLWYPFFTLFKRYFKYDCPVWLNTESKSYTIDNLRINCLDEDFSNLSWGGRFKKYLEVLESEYVLVFLDDFFLRKPVNVTVLDKCMQVMDKDPSVINFSFANVKDDHNKPSKYPGFLVRPQYGKYKLNLQVGLWRTHQLLELVQPYDTPWDLEDYGNYRTFLIPFNFYCVKENGLYFDYGFKDSGMGVYRGKWVKKDICDLFAKEHIDVDFNKRGFFEDNLESPKPFLRKLSDLPKTLKMNWANLNKIIKNLIMSFEYRNL